MPLPGGTSKLRSTRPNVVPLLATRCLYWGSILLKCKKDTSKFEHTSHFVNKEQAIGDKRVLLNRDGENKNKDSDRCIKTRYGRIIRKPDRLAY